MRRLTPPRRDHWSIFGRNRANPFTANWSWTSCSQWLRVHSACHARAGDACTSPAWTTPASWNGGITVVVVAPFIGWASPPLVHGALSGPNRTDPYSSLIAAGSAGRTRPTAYSTVTLFARFLGWSTSQSRSRAMWYARSCSGIDQRIGVRSSDVGGSLTTCSVRVVVWSSPWLARLTMRPFGPLTSSRYTLTF